MPKIKGTIDTFIDSLSQEEKNQFYDEYRELLVSEMLIAAMEKDEVSVRALAKAAGVSPTTVQGIRSGANNPTIENFFKIFSALGYTIVAEKDDERFALCFSH